MTSWLQGERLDELSTKQVSQMDFKERVHTKNDFNCLKKITKKSITVKIRINFYIIPYKMRFTIFFLYTYYLNYLLLSQL